ncbi:MAG: anthranilate phosphoribosyltransferase [Nitrospinae bacterium]|nr:anthranilate phosphoribosyltransferase [Nitrospinota bacterium]
MNINQAIEQLVATKTDLTKDDAFSIFEAILNGECSSPAIASFLTALRSKGESVSELLGGYNALMKYCSFIQPNRENLVDPVGTGGDLTGTFNISTTSAFVAAGAGVNIAKHGNRSVSSKSGAADVLEKLGLNITLSPEQCKKVIEEVGISFLFAPVFHSAMKHAVEARKEMKIRTIFNILGPICNPAGVKKQVIGIFDHSWAGKIAEVLKQKGSEHILIVTGVDGMDEITLTGETKVTELKMGKISEYSIKPEDFGFTCCSLNDLKGGGAEENNLIVKKILSGKDTSPKRDIVLLNAGATIYVSGKTASIAEGIELARRSIDSGNAMKKLEDLVKVTTSF